jgi:soluble cytochrome b562
MTNNKTVKADVQPYEKVILVKRDGTEEVHEIKESSSFILSMVHEVEEGRKLQIMNAASLPAMNAIAENLQELVKQEMLANAPEGLRALLGMLDDALKRAEK